MNYDLISRSELVEYFRGKADACRFDSVEQNVWQSAFEAVQDEDPVDAEPVRHGEWMPTNDDNKKRCSRCDIIHLIAQYPHGNANYCPNCGAKMDGGKDAE